MTPTQKHALAYAVPAAVSLLLTHLLLVQERDSYFLDYFGAIDARLAVGGVAAVGAAALALLWRRGWRVWPAQWAGAALWLLAAPLFAALAVGADLMLGFPRDINIPGPWSLLFYPVMGFVAEVVFHAAPLAMLAAVLGERLRRQWRWLIPIALIEPAFQVRAALADLNASPLDVFVFGHVLALNLVELELFRRHGFLPAWAFRLSYYLLWHVAWGHWRLS